MDDDERATEREAAITILLSGMIVKESIVVERAIAKIVDDASRTRKDRRQEICARSGCCRRGNKGAVMAKNFKKEMVYKTTFPNSKIYIGLIFRFRFKT